MDTTLTTTTPAPAATDRPRASGLRFSGLAVALWTGPAALAVTNFLYAMATRDGGSDENGAEALKLAADHTTAARALIGFGLIGSILMVPVALGAIRLIGQRAARLGFIGGTLMAAGYICYFGVILTNPIIVEMAEHGGPLGDFAAVIDASEGSSSGFWVFPLFALGNLAGTFILGLALLRSRVVPVWAAAGVMAWPPLHILGLFVLGNEWPEVVGAVIQAIAFAVVGAKLLATRPTI
jgi:hypothetical protein